MNTQQFRVSIDALHQRLLQLSATKGEEYKRREDDQFANFERGAAALGLTREQVLLVYLSKHYDSIVTFVKDRANPERSYEYSEPIEGRIDDAILYLLLLRGMVAKSNAREYEYAFDVAVGPDGRVRAENVELLPQKVEPEGQCIFVSENPKLAQDWCRVRGQPIGSHALYSEHQLHGLRPPVRVFCVTHPFHRHTPHDHFLDAVADRCQRQGIWAGEIPAVGAFEGNLADVVAREPDQTP